MLQIRTPCEASDAVNGLDMKIGLMAQSLQGLVEAVEAASHRLVMEPRLGH
jgi:hypothetical protein